MDRTTTNRGIRAVGLLATIAAVGALLVPAATAAVGTNTKALRDAVTVPGIRQHQAALQAIADANGGTRASGTPGFDASADYVVAELEAAGYSPDRQTFTYNFFQELAPPTLEQVSPNAKIHSDILTMEYSGSGDVTARIRATNDVQIPPGATAGSSTSGCEASDFTGFTPGDVALIQRGTCTFYDKAANAQAAGASAVLIFNEGQEGRQETLAGTLGGVGITIPVLGTSYALGEELFTLTGSGPVVVHVTTSTITEIRTTENIIAQTAKGRGDRVVVVGAHLDSVIEGPGINDNGSGSAAILEIAEQMAALGVVPRNKVRFAWWGAEEAGLFGSEYYVANLTARQRKNIALNLNFDMIGSPNFVRFVYDGDGSATGTAGPTGSDVIEKVFLDYFSARDLPTESSPFNGRSDYGPFIDVGIPAGGLFTGAEGIKTAEQASIFGGTAGVAYDPCYHQACDTYANNNDTALDQMSDAAAHAVLTFAMTTSSVSGTTKGNGIGLLEYDGSLAQL